MTEDFIRVKYKNVDVEFWDNRVFVNAISVQTALILIDRKSVV